jgi:serine protease Do
VIGLHSAIEVSEESNYDVPVDLYLKYWTALNKPLVYTKYPEMTESTAFKSNASPGLKSDMNIKDFKLTNLNSVITIYSRIKDVLQSVSGTVFSIYTQGSKRNFIVSKSSMVGSGSVFIKVGEKSIDVRVLSRDKLNDLVLLTTNTSLKGGLDYNAICGIKDTIRAGKFLISLRPVTSGVISISGGETCSIPKKINAPFIGVGFKTQNAPFNISYIFPNLNGTIYKLKIGDELLSINGFTSSTLKELFDRLQNYWPGDTVKLKLKRSGMIIEEEIVLDEIPLRHINHPAEYFLGGKSYRRDGFNNVFLHDAVLKPDQCGGPVFDLSGKFCGINIARYSRAICLAIPDNLVFKFIDFSLSKSAHAPYHERESK